MNNHSIAYALKLLLIILIIVFSYSCSKDEKDHVPYIETLPVQNITSTTAEGGGNITSDGGTAILSRGVCWSYSINPTISDNKTTEGAGIGEFTSLMAELTLNTTYYVRAYATNKIGTSYGAEICFKTSTVTPSIIVTTSIPSLVTLTTAYGGGLVTNDGDLEITARGLCWSTTPNPVVTLNHTTDGSGIGEFVSTITGLTEKTKYYLRAYATNLKETVYGNEISITTSSPELSVIDLDGNEYNTVNIGTQTWMKENLKVTKFIDGTLLPNIENINLWIEQSDRAYCWYDNDIKNKNLYGAIYNIYTVLDSRNICPSGWHVPSDVEWTILENYLGGSAVAGGKLKATIFWASPNSGANNSSGFSAFPSGYLFGGCMAGIGQYGGWWTSTEIVAPEISAWIRKLNYNSSSILRLGVHTNPGYSIRCIRDF